MSELVIVKVFNKLFSQIVLLQIEISSRSVSLNSKTIQGVVSSSYTTRIHSTNLHSLIYAFDLPKYTPWFTEYVFINYQICCLPVTDLRIKPNFNVTPYKSYENNPSHLNNLFYILYVTGFSPDL